MVLFLLYAQLVSNDRARTRCKRELEILFHAVRFLYLPLVYAAIHRNRGCHSRSCGGRNGLPRCRTNLPRLSSRVRLERLRSSRSRSRVRLLRQGGNVPTWFDFAGTFISSASALRRSSSAKTTRISFSFPFGVSARRCTAGHCIECSSARLDYRRGRSAQLCLVRRRTPMGRQCGASSTL